MLVFATLLATLSSTVRSRAALELENLALRHQIGVLQRSTKRPKLTPVDRLLWCHSPKIVTARNLNDLHLRRFPPNG